MYYEGNSSQILTNIDIFKFDFYLLLNPGLG